MLTEDLPEETLKAGDTGTVVHIHQGGAGYEVELMTPTGDTISVVTLPASQVRPLARRDMARVREVQPV